MKSRASAIFLVAAVLTGGVLRGVRAEDDPRLRAVIAKVGTTEITAFALEKKLRVMPDFQIATFGSTPDEVRRNFLERVIIPEALLAERAKDVKLDEAVSTRERLDDVLRLARLNLLKSELAVTPDEVQAFYRENRERFQTPERIAISRILCSTRAEAVAVLAKAKAAGGLKKWNDLAREHSLDKATAYRGGFLGALAADGTSSEVSVHADPAIYGAATRVKDGEIVGEPVEEGPAFAVIWRRGSTPAVNRAVEEEADSIRQVVARQKLEGAAKELTARLRAASKIERQPQLIDLLEVTPSGEVAAKQRPGLVPRKPATPPAPTATPHGHR